MPCPSPTRSFDLVVLMHALTYAAKPAQAVAEAARVLRPGGRLLLCSLARHEHRAAVEAYGHVNLGFSDKELRRFADKAGLEVASCETVTREKRPPHFEVISLIGAQAMSDCHMSIPALAASRRASPRCEAALAERILIIDGAMGTMIQRHGLEEADYRGERFADGYDALFTRPSGHAHGPGCGCEATTRATTTCSR